MPDGPFDVILSRYAAAPKQKSQDNKSLFHKTSQGTPTQVKQKQKTWSISIISFLLTAPKLSF